jgi:hypothetical protein
MPGQNDKVDQKQELPKETSLYLWSSDVFDRFETLLKKVGSGEERVSDLSALVFEVCEGKISPEMFASSVLDFGLQEEKAKELVKSVYLEILLKIVKDLPFDVRREIASLGGGEVAQHAEEKFDVAMYVKAYVAGLPGGHEERLRQRLEVTLLSYLQGTLSREQAKEKLQHPIKLGGLEITSEVAEEVLGNFDKDKEGKEFVGKMHEAVLTPPAPSLVRGGTVRDDEKEIEEVKQKVASVIEAPAPTDIPAVVKMICDYDAFGFDDPLLNDRCKKIVESRVREVRDATLARAQFERSVDKGGLGVSGRRLADILERLETVVSLYEKAQVERHAEGKTLAVQERQKARDAKTEAVKNEETNLDKRFKDLVGDVAIDTQKMRGAIEGAKQASSKAPKVFSPTMQEIAFEKRLTGPVDELRRMTLIEFRRLSRDPVQAATKIKDKVGILEEQGYDKKIEGVKAWRSSPLNSLYLKLTHEALLGGKGIKEVIEEYANKKEETLTVDEYHAVAAINGELRF